MAMVSLRKKVILAIGLSGLAMNLHGAARTREWLRLGLWIEIA